MRKNKKNLLVINPTMDENDDNQSTLQLWIKKLSPHFHHIDVITLKKGYVSDTPHLNVYGLNKYKNKLLKLIYFYYLAFKLTPKCHVILTQMFPEFPIFIFPVAFLFRKSIVMYYSHSHASNILKIAHKLVTREVTTSKNSFALPQEKCAVIGHGINTNVFKPCDKSNNQKYVLCTDRISPSKGLDIIIKAYKNLSLKKDVQLLPIHFYGRTDINYLKELNCLIHKLKLSKFFIFKNSVPLNKIPDIINDCLFFVSANRVQGVSKAALEAMACEKAAVLCDTDYFDVLGKYKKYLFFQRNNAEQLTEKLYFLFKNPHLLKEIGGYLRNNVVKYHNIDHFISSLTNIIYAEA